MTRYVAIGVLSAILLVSAAPAMALQGDRSIRGTVETWLVTVWNGFDSLFGENEAWAKDDADEMTLPRDDDDSDGTIGDVIIPRK